MNFKQAFSEITLLLEHWHGPHLKVCMYPPQKYQDLFGSSNMEQRKCGTNLSIVMEWLIEYDQGNWKNIKWFVYCKIFQCPQNSPRARILDGPESASMYNNIYIQIKCSRYINLAVCWLDWCGHLDIQARIDQSSAVLFSLESHKTLTLRESSVGSTGTLDSSVSRLTISASVPASQAHKYLLVRRFLASIGQKIPEEESALSN